MVLGGLCCVVCARVLWGLRVGVLCALLSVSYGGCAGVVCAFVGCVRVCVWVARLVWVVYIIRILYIYIFYDN